MFVRPSVGIYSDSDETTVISDKLIRSEGDLELVILRFTSRSSDNPRWTTDHGVTDVTDQELGEKNSKLLLGQMSGTPRSL